MKFGVFDHMDRAGANLGRQFDERLRLIELYEKGGLRAPGGQPLNIFATLAHHPALLRRWLVFASHVLAKSSLTPRDRELAISFLHHMAVQRQVRNPFESAGERGRARRAHLCTKSEAPAPCLARGPEP